MTPKGKWARGIVPRNFHWIVKEQLAVCERPGGYGANHRRVRRQEEIIWLRESGFGCVISLIPSPHNLHNYDELGVAWQHRPFTAEDDETTYLSDLYPELDRLRAEGTLVVLHQDELSVRLVGVVAGYVLWAGLLDNGPQTISVVERMVDRQMGPTGRGLVTLAIGLRDQRAAST
ncbi:MAG: hypothetical protein ABWZ68_05755 [Acidimicrobiales bacterium]